jgi:phosphate transport system protein
MRTLFHEQLAAIERRIGIGLDLSVATLQEIGEAVADTAAPTPSSIERKAGSLRDSSRESTEMLVATMARQAPVAEDLRLMLVLIEIAHHCGLLANQFDLMAAQLMEIDPEVPDRLGTSAKLAGMSELVCTQLSAAAAALKQRDPQLARQVGADDDAVNRLNREVFSTTLLSAESLQTRELAMRHVLIARSLERVGDNAVDIAEQAVFLVTGEQHQFTDASHPQ